MKRSLDDILINVKSPGRYVNGEFNVIKKDWSDPNIKLKVALAFPDLYEVGMSNLGFQIIYHLLNRRRDVLCERVFVPDIDMENLLRYYKIPLFSLEGKVPLKNFDWIGFSISYELNYSGILTILSLAGIPFLSAERGKDDPLIIAGGPSVLNPEPIAPFIDIFFVGEAEETLDKVVDVFIEWKNYSNDRMELYKNLVKFGCIYIPSLYDFKDKKVYPIYDWAPKRIKKEIVKDLDNAFFPTKPLVPIQSVVHDRGVVEIMRGCHRNCRFCLAGYVYRPKRYRSPDKIREYVREIIKNTGYEEISLLSLSSNDYPYIEELIDELNDEFSKNYINFSLPSLRADKFSLDLSKKLSKVRKSGLTFAIEAGTERLRKVINKGLKTEDFLNTVKTAYSMGWRRIKLYFMLGLPTESNEDIRELTNLMWQIVKENKGIHLHLGFSIFIPKPHTPFQWEKFEEKEIIKEREHMILHALKKGPFDIDFHDYNMSYLEAIFSRGDRNLSKVLEKAWSKGSRLEGWKDYLNIDYWKEAFEEEGVDPKDYLRERDLNENLPWDHIDVGVNKEYLMKEREKAYSGKDTPPCEWGKYCELCGACYG